ncbi:putative polypeptide N-acetylgalactosaminyltransferase 9 [Epargyreus clarus]|uniref:putative polypeptide N-acetylgalactosaminyltransferase 9 n=1 Tax=Epargyreus clarus TaxID=520877 RepID=UPI003C2CF357
MFSFEMTHKRLYKILFLLFVFWGASILSILRDYKSRLELSDNQIYDRAWKKFKMKHSADYDNTTSPFAVWQEMDPISEHLSVKDKLNAVKGFDFPPGMEGKPVVIEEKVRGTVKLLIKKGWEDHALNQFVSDLIPMNRTLPDVRDKRCKTKFPKDLPQASVVICFYNEAWSTLLRTIQSVISRSPPHLLNEIILIDDYSTMNHLKAPLDDFARTIPNLLLLRGQRRAGLIRARILGAKHAVSPVVIFLDSHCECTEGWLEPLLERIARDNTTVVSPVVDHIHDNTFEYIPQDLNDLRIGGFNWDLRFTWRAIPREIQAKRKNVVAPLKTPTISGGLYAINKEFFKMLGYYDEGFEIWGAENLELSFKVWMCGGTLEIVPCSHVGHVFRKRFPYEGRKGSVRNNFVRLAEVWLDDYAKYYYERIGDIKGEYGNVTKQKELRKTLNCKSFKWYLQNVYPEMQIPDNYVASGQIYNTGVYTMCLDASLLGMNLQENVKLMPCHFQGGNQYWVYTKDGEIRRDDMCLDFILNTVMLFFCRGRVASQIWLYDNKTENIRHMKTQNCLQAARFHQKYKVILDKCTTSSAQKWIMDKYNVERLTPELQIAAKMQM